MSCESCRQQVNRASKSKITCSNCSCMFHGACVELTDNDLEVFQGTGKVWSCKKCTSALRLQRANSDSTPVKANTNSATSGSAPVTMEQLNSLLTKVKDELLDKLGAEIAACRKTLEEKVKEIAKQGASITALKEENSHLKTKLRELELKQDDQEQYGRRNTLEVFGVPETNNEDVQGRILEIGRALNVKLDRTSIDACHRLPRRKDNIAPGIIVRFVRRGDKDALLKNRKQCRDFSTQHIKLQGNSPIYINQSLTADRRRLFGQVKKVQRERGFRHVWIDRVGRIKVRWEDGGSIHIVRCDEDLHNLKNEKKDDAGVTEMTRQQSALVVGLATDLRQVIPQEPFWRQTIERYAAQHESLILSAVSSGYPQRGTIWTYPGSLLFATSLLTTLGFGAPVPRTVVGRMCAIIFAGLGIPVHLLLVLNIGLLIAVKLTRLANILEKKAKRVKLKIHRVQTRENDDKESWPEELFACDRIMPPFWLKFFPFVAIPTYYLTGFLLFGLARGKEFPEIFLFPLDFTAAGGVASTYGPLRIAYAMYLEGAVILASTNVALLRVSATRGFTTAAIKMGLMTNSHR